MDAEFQLHDFHSRICEFVVNFLCIATNRDLMGLISGLSTLQQLDESV